MAYRICSQCGHPSDARLHECASCGTSLITPRQDEPPEPVIVPGAGAGFPSNHIQPSRRNLHRPEKVNQAVMLLHLTLGIAVVRTILERATMDADIGFVIFVSLFTLGFLWFFIAMIARGKNWARITFLVLFVGGLPFAITPLLQSLAATPLSGLLGIAQTVLQIVALIFLFQKASSEWFKEMKGLRAFPHSG